MSPWVSPAVWVALALVLSACEVAPPAPAAGLDARAWLVRASLDIRGTRPTLAEVERVEAAPGAAAAIIAAMVDDPRLEQRVRTIFATALRTRQDHYPLDAESFGLSDDEDAALQRALAEEVPSIIAYVAVSDQPFSSIFTADYTVVDPILTRIFPIEVVATQPADLPETTVMARYVDGRPVAGILAASSIYWRHTSTLENANRGRSNALARALLCEDYLDKPIEFPKDVDLTDSASIRQAISSNGACRACHSTLDPFASHLWGFMLTEDDNPWAWTRYAAEKERLWQSQGEAGPGYFGEPSDGTLRGLARAVASDERFVACTVRRVYEDLLGRPAAFTDEGQLVAHREAFLSSGLSFKALVRSVVLDPAYRGIAQASAFGGRPEPVARKLVAPTIIASSLLDLSGHRLVVDGRDVTEVDYGLRAFGGDSERGPSREPSLGYPIVVRRLAEAAARASVNGAFPASRVGRWLASADLDAPPTAAVATAIFREVHSRHPTPVELAALAQLWAASAADGAGGPEAWTAWLTATFADPTLALY